jgi:hypothetical protein
MARKGIKARATSRKAVKAQSDYSLFKALAPRMMRDLMRDFSPLADFQAAGAVGTQPYQDRRAAMGSFNGREWALSQSPAGVVFSKIS